MRARGPLIPGAGVLLVVLALTLGWREWTSTGGEGRDGLARGAPAAREAAPPRPVELVQAPRVPATIASEPEPEPAARRDVPDPGGPYRLWGRLDARPRSSANVQVSLHAGETGELLARTGTNLSGRFEFAEAPGGEVELRVDLVDGARPPRQPPELRLRVRLDADRDVGTWTLFGEPPPPRPETGIDAESEVVLVSVLRRGRLTSGVTVVGREEGGTLRLPARRQEDGRYRLEWRLEYGPLRICVEDSSGALLAATPIAQHYAPGAESEVTLDVASGSLLLHLPHDYVIHEGTRLQLVLEGAAFPVGSEPVRTLSRRGAAHGAPTFAGCDAYFPVLPVGTLTIRSTVLQKGRDGAWRIVGVGPSATASILADEETVVRF